jgi:hypothetical protein
MAINWARLIWQRHKGVIERRLIAAPWLSDGRAADFEGESAGSDVRQGSSIRRMGIPQGEETRELACDVRDPSQQGQW